MEDFVRDVALAEEKDGRILVHRANCTYVRMLAMLGQPVATLIDIKNPVPDDYERHSCMKT